MFSNFDAALPEVAVQRALGNAQPFGDVVHAQALLAVQGFGGESTAALGLARLLDF